jgi:glutamate--cysteine ligase
MNVTSKEKLLKIFTPTISKDSERKIGVEIERLGFINGKPITFPQMEIFLNELHKEYQWPKILGENNHTIGVKTPMGKLSLEPGSQLEFSANAQSSVEDFKTVYQKLNQLIEPFKQKHSIEWLDVALNPYNSVEDIRIIPNKRYEIMTEYFKNRGSLSTTMMRLTSSIQINFDYLSFEEAIGMLKVGILLTPISYSLFANSRHFKNKDTGYRSYRAEVWRKTDPDRSGLIPELFAKENFSIEDYIEIVRTRPLMYAQDKKGNNVAANGLSLKDIEEGKLHNCIVDENNLVNAYRELFFEARLKPGYIEIRSIDYVPEPRLYEALAFWLAAIYSKENRQKVLNYFKGSSYQDIYNLWIEASKNGLPVSLLNNLSF